MVISMMMEMVLGEVEEEAGVPMNLEVVTLYTYKDYFLLEPKGKETKIKTNLIISRASAELTERSTSHPIVGMNDPIDQNYSEKASYSAFLGLLTILSRTMLLLVRECEKACAIEGQEIW